MKIFKTTATNVLTLMGAALLVYGGLYEHMCVHTCEEDDVSGWWLCGCCCCYQFWT